MATWGEYFLSFIRTPPTNVPQPMPMEPVVPPPKRDFDRNFIMLGKVNSGKSTLANLLFGCKKEFPVHPYRQSVGCTKKVSNRETEVPSSIVFGDTYVGNDTLKIQITDLPGTNDHEFNDSKQCQHLLQTIKDSRAVLSDTFLIVCDISGKYFSTEEFISILNIAEILSHAGYMFYQNAILVFTHADECDNPQGRLNAILPTEEWACIGKLLESIDNRHLFIDSLDQSEKNRNSLLKTLFELSKPTLNVAITGNNGFQSSEFREILSLHNNTLFQKASEKFNIEYFFNPNLNIFHRFDKLNIEQRLEDELNKLFIISKGISVMVVLISLEDSFTREFYDIINQIPETFSIQKSENTKQDPLWKYSFIIFLSPIDDKDIVEENMELNPLLKEIVTRVNDRYTWVTRDMLPDECYTRLVNMIFKVNNDTQGTSFINKTIISKISEDIKSSRSTKEPQLGNVVESNKMQRNIPFFETNEDLWIQANTFNWNKGEISHLMAYFLVKRVKPEAAASFSEKFANRGSAIPKEDFKEFCLEHLK